MSVRAMTWAFEANLEPLAKIVLLALADHAGDDDLAYPSVKKLAKKSSTSPRTVQRRLRDLEDRGFVTVVKVGNGRKPSLYRCNIEGCHTVTPDTVDTSGASDSHPRGDTVVTHNHHLTVSEPSFSIRDLGRAVSLYNTAAQSSGLPKALKLTSARQSKLKARLNDCGGLDGWRLAMERLKASDYCTGKVNGWRADLDFVLQEKSFTRLMEGSYDNRGSPPGKQSQHRTHMNNLWEILADDEHSERETENHSNATCLLADSR